MTIMIISNVKGFQNNIYNVILLYKLGNITDYINLYIFFLIHEIIIGVTPTSLADKMLCMPIQSLHHIVHIITF